VLAQIVTGDWPTWETRLWKVASRDPGELSLRQLLTLTEGLLRDGRDAQGCENLDAVFEDRLPVNLTTGKPLGLESDDPDVRHATRLKMLERKQREDQRGE